MSGKPDPTMALRALALARAYDGLDIGAVVALTPNDLNDANSLIVTLCAMANATLQMLCEATSRTPDAIRQQMRGRIIEKAAS